MIEEILVWAQHQITNNDVFAGIVGGSALMSGLYTLRYLPDKAWDLFLRLFTCSIVVYNEDDAYPWLDEWLSLHPYSRVTRRMKLSTMWGDDRSGERWHIIPGVGRHLLWHAGRPMIVSRREESDKGSASHKRRENIEIRALGRSQHTVRDVLRIARELGEENDLVKVHLYNRGWDRVAVKLARNPDSVVLPVGQMDRIMADAKWFFSSEDWYRERSVPYRRGYLLSGPPGTGKSSIVMVLASYFKRPVYILNMGSLFSDGDLLSAITNVPHDGLLLIEDVDATGASKNRLPDPPNDSLVSEKKDEDTGGFITMSAFLNAIDGIVGTDGRLLVMTTNHPDKLDPALIRPGRVDLHEVLGLLNPESADRLFLRFYPDRADLVDAFVAGVQLPMSAAELQNMCLRHKDDPEALVGACREAA